MTQLARPLTIGAAFGALAVLTVALVIVLGVVPGGREDALPPAVVLSFVAESEDGGPVTPVIVLVDTVTGDVRVLDASTEVTIPGTSFSRLQDAYAFGGGEGLTRAVGRLAYTDVSTPAYIVFEKAAWQERIDAAGGITVELPQSVDVFTGEKLYTFPAGTVTLQGDEASIVLQGVAYFDDANRSLVIQQFADALVYLLVEGGAVTAGVGTNLSQDAYEQLRGLLR